MVNASKGYLIQSPKSNKELLYPKGVTKDIIEVVLEVERSSREDTKAFAKCFNPTYQGMKDLWHFVKDNIRYQEDPDGQQWVQTPGHLWRKRVGDCKSFTIFICSVLHHLGLNYVIRFTSYDVFSKIVTHVYPIAILPDGKEVILDAVYTHFDQQKKPFYYHKDYKFTNMAKIYKLSGINRRAIGELQDAKTAIQEIEAIMADVPDSVITDGKGDLTQMSAGEFERQQIAETWRLQAGNLPEKRAVEVRKAANVLESGSIAGIGSLAPSVQKDVQKVLRKTGAKKKPAFEPPSMPDIVIDHNDPQVQGLFKVIKKGAKAVKNAFGKVWKKFINWVWKGPLKKIGPYFLFQFITGKVSAKEIVRRKLKQSRALGWIGSKGKFEKGKLMREMHNSIVKQTGKTPRQLISIASRGKIGAIPPIPPAAIAKFANIAITAIKIIMQIIGKIAKIFKKKASDAGHISPENASDLSLLEGEFDNYEQPGPSSSSSSGGGSNLAIPAALGAGLLFMFM